LQIELKRIQADIGITFVHVTHDQEEALTMADTIAVMNEGRIEQMGSGEELYERPRTEFVANFLGISNLVDGTVGSRDGTMATFDAEEGERVFVPSDRFANVNGGPIRIGIRPEKIEIASSDSSPRGLEREPQRDSRPRNSRELPWHVDSVRRRDQDGS
jgi:spermidine/putrescine transport system ATP-binding protein